MKTATQFDQELSRLEEIIVMRTNFTGDPPYVGIDGLCLALKEALDERDKLRRQVWANASQTIDIPESEKEEYLRKIRSEHGVYS